MEEKRRVTCKCVTSMQSLRNIYSKNSTRQDSESNAKSPFPVITFQSFTCHVAFKSAHI